MKKIMLFALTIGLLSVTSCDKFLEENPRTQASTDDFFSSPSDAISSVNRLYKLGMPEDYNAGSAYIGPDIMYTGYQSGLYDNEYKGQEVFVSHCQNLAVDSNIDNNKLQGLWEGPYRAIVRTANFAIKNIPTCPGLSDEQQRQYMAEARFFRALNYFYLVKMFGAIPLIEDTYQALENLYIPRSSETKIYEFIEKDLLAALEGGLAKTSMPANGYRVSDGSVRALLADVYLNWAGYPLNNTAKYAEAAKFAKSITDDAAYKLIEGIPASGNTPEQTPFDILRTSDDQSEYLYLIEYFTSIQDGGWRPTYCFPNPAATWGEFKYDITCQVYNPVQVLHAFYGQYNGDDIRYSENQYFHTTYTQEMGDNKGTVRSLGQYPLPYIWWEREAMLNTRTSQKDQVHYRTAEMYLIAAEAIVKSGGSVAEAAKYLAAIQARASRTKDAATIEASLITLSAEDFVTEVWKEKVRELIFENKMWNDITRTRMYPAVDASNNPTFVNLIGATNPWGKTFAEKDLYFPICSQEQQRNPALADPPLQ